MVLSKFLLITFTIAFMYFYIPLAFSFAYPSANFGATKLGKVYFVLNKTLMFSMFAEAWIGIVMIIICIKSWMNNNITITQKILITVLITIVINIMLFPIISTMNLLMFLFITNPPFIEDYHSVFPTSLILERNYYQIKEEFEKNKNITPACMTIPSFVVGTGNADQCWRMLHLKTTGKMVPGIEKRFPVLCELIRDSCIHNAFFSVLDSHIGIPPHRGYCKSYLRYHLGISIPNQDKEIRPYIVVGGVKYAWREGEGVMFDDMYMHEVVNKSDTKRVVLFIDVIRPGLIHKAMVSYLESSPVIQYIMEKQHNTTSV